VVVDSISPIENADAIEVANIMGWKCVIKKNTFKAGDKAVYFEIDSMLSMDDRRFDFLAALAKIRTMDGVKGYVITTKKLRGVYSQGLLLPLADFPEVADKNIGDDVTAVLSVRKYEPPPEGDGKHLCGDAKGSFPSFFPKTDQERCQNIDLQRFAGIKYEVTTKCDGSSFSAFMINGEFGVCSRNTNFKVGEGENVDNKYVSMARELNIEKKLRDAGLDNLAIQGELCGPKINGNRAKLQDFHVFMFDVFDIKRGAYVGHHERMEIVNKLGLESVPVEKIDFSIDGLSKNDLLAMADGLFNGHAREGLVFKDMNGGFNSFKAVSNKYLLKHGDE
jgi:RNA ligase (TIGR02306 family)